MTFDEGEHARALTRVLLGIGLLALAACGGGGGGGGGGDEPDPVLYSGTYGHTEFTAGSEPAHIVDTQWGRRLSDGAGGCPFDGHTNSNTNVGAAGADMTYAVGTGRALTLSISGTPLFAGRVSASGALAVFATHLAGRRPGIQIDIRRDGSHADSDLLGDYTLCSIEYLFGSDQVRGVVGSLDFNGSGTWTGSYTLNAEGTVTPGVSFSAGAYQVQADGTTQVTYDFGLRNEGQLLQGGDVLAVAGGIMTGSNLYMSVYVRGSSGKTAASFSGTYAVSGLTYDYRPGVREWAGLFGTLTADGAGGYTATLRRNMSDAVSSPFTETGSYTVSAAGGIRFTGDDGVVRHGALSPDTTFCAYGGGLSANSFPALFVLVK